MHGNEGNANQEVVSGRALQRESRCQAGQLKVLTQQRKRGVQKTKSGLKSAGTEKHRIRKVL